MQTSSAAAKPREHKTRGRGGRPRADRNLASWLALGTFGLNVTLGAVPSVLLATQLKHIDPAHKTTDLAIVLAAGALVATAAQPVWGAVSDRTRSRYGKRSPYLLCCPLLTALALPAMSFATTVAMLTVTWCLVQAVLTGAAATLVTVLPDRVPAATRGRVAAWMGLGTMMGTLGGQGIAAVLVSQSLRLAYTAIAVLLVTALTAFAFACPEPDNRSEPRRALDIRALIRSYWINPRHHRDFAWVFVARTFLMLGYYMIAGYMLYILQDYVHLSQDRATKTVPIVSLVALAGTVTTLLPAGRLSDRIGRRKPFVAASTLAIGAGLAIPAILPTKTGVLMMALIAGLGFGCYNAVDNALISQVLPSTEDTAKDMGLANISAHLPQVLAPVASGTVIAIFGGYRTLFALALTFSLIGALCVLPVKTVR